MSLKVAVAILFVSVTSIPLSFACLLMGHVSISVFFLALSVGFGLVYSFFKNKEIEEAYKDF